MIILLTGFSGTGKSYWAKSLRDELSFNYYCCDDEIAKHLSDELDQAIVGTAGLAQWVGRPDSLNAQERERHYLKLENLALETFYPLLNEDLRNGRNAVLASTGSLVDCKPELTQRLAQCATVVYLRLDEKAISEAFETYRRVPKPIVWDGLFSIRSGENFEQALERSFYELIAARRKRYEKLADVTLPYEFHQQEGLSSKEFLSEIEKKLHES